MITKNRLPESGKEEVTKSPSLPLNDQQTVGIARLSLQKDYHDLFQDAVNRAYIRGPETKTTPDRVMRQHRLYKPTKPSR